MQGGIHGTVPLTAYVVAALLETGMASEVSTGWLGERVGSFPRRPGWPSSGRLFFSLDALLPLFLMLFGDPRMSIFLESEQRIERSCDN